MGLNLVRYRGWFYLFSLIVLLPGVISLLIAPRLKAGIDFTGGSEFTVRFEQEVSQDDLKGALSDLGHPEARIQGTGENEYLVRTKELQGALTAPPLWPQPAGLEQEEIQDGLIERFGPLLGADGEPSDSFISSDSISETISKEIRQNATFAIIAASVALFFFLWCVARFSRTIDESTDRKFGPVERRIINK